MLTLNNIDVYCISINEDKRNHIRDQFKDHKKKLIFVDGVTGYHPFAGAGLAWVKVLSKILFDIDHKITTLPVMVIEDDVTLKQDSLNRQINVPNDAHVLYTGVSLYGMKHDCDEAAPDVIGTECSDSKDVVRVYNMLSMHSMVFYSVNYIATCIASLTEAVVKTSIGNITPCDIPITRLECIYNAYALKAPLMFQDLNFGGQQVATKILLNYRSPRSNEVNEHKKYLPISAKHVIYE